LNRLEYASFVGFKRKALHKTSSGRQCASDFDFGSGHVLGAHKVQYLQAKQRTVICCGRQPPHPGEEPSNHDSAAHKQWKKRADEFAEYVLVVFRPELDMYERGQVNDYGYQWEDLSAYLDKLLDETSFLSRLRLRAMQARVNGLSASYRAKVIMAKYRQKSRTMWTEEDKGMYKRDRQYNEASRRHDGSILDEHVFQQTHDVLPNQIMTDICKQLSYCKGELEMMDQTFSKFDGATKGTHDNDTAAAVGASSSCVYLSCPSEMLHEKLETLKHMADLPTIVPSREPASSEREFASRRIYGNNEQEHVRDLFEKYVLTGEDKHPFRYLLTGPPGTGKSHTIEMLRSATLQSTTSSTGLVQTFAFFGIAAINVNGTTLSSVVHCKVPGKDDQVTDVTPLSADMLKQFCSEISYNPGQSDCVALIVIDEISTVTPGMLAIYSLRFQQATGINKPFGGIPILLVGDFSQLPPVKSGDASLASSAVQIKEFDKK